MRYVLLAAITAAGCFVCDGQAPDAAERPLSITLDNAIKRARDYGQQYLAAGTAAALAREDRIQARAALLPTISSLNQYTHTQDNGTSSGVFIANDGPNVYNEQAVAHAELFSVTKTAEYRKAQAAEAAALARRDIAGRGLVATVVQDYYALVSAKRRSGNAARSVDEARRFLDITRKQEAGGEVARADVIKAELQLQQRQRDQLDAETNIEKAKLNLAVLIFRDIDQPFEAVDDLEADLPRPAVEDICSRAFIKNPEIRAAEAGVSQAAAGEKAAKGAFVPSVAFDYFYGINANVFGIHGPENRRNLGSAVQATVIIPVWDWGALKSKVRQAALEKRQAETDLSYTRRQLRATVDSAALEAQTARTQLASLRSSLDLATESVRLTVLRYEAGEATALEVVDAETTLADARNSYDDGLARNRIALANLQTLMGSAP
jgi:outer membrane protein TolC